MTLVRSTYPTIAAHLGLAGAAHVVTMVKIPKSILFFSKYYKYPMLTKSESLSSNPISGLNMTTKRPCC
jgi:hypothetical protein